MTEQLDLRPPQQQAAVAQPLSASLSSLQSWSSLRSSASPRHRSSTLRPLRSVRWRLCATPRGELQACQIWLLYRPFSLPSSSPREICSQPSWPCSYLPLAWRQPRCTLCCRRMRFRRGPCKMLPRSPSWPSVSQERPPRGPVAQPRPALPVLRRELSPFSLWPDASELAARPELQVRFRLPETVQPAAVPEVPPPAEFPAAEMSCPAPSAPVRRCRQ